MYRQDGTPILERIRPAFRDIVEKARLLDSNVSVLATPLTPEEAIGTPGRRDFPIVTGKERVLEALVHGAKGHAFTDSPREFEGTLAAVLDLELTTNQDRAVYVATLNAVLAHIKMVDGTVHCKDEDPEKCAREIAAHVYEKYGAVNVGLIGLNPAIAERLVETFGAARVHVSDLYAGNIGQRRFGVEIWDGNARNEELIEASRVIVFTGTTLLNGTFDRIWAAIEDRGRIPIVYGVTAAGVARLAGFERICFYGRDG
ncbi:MAG: DUF364 domain-containing protein [bacterium]